MRKRYGAIGGDIYSCVRRSTADRIRKVIRLHREVGGWCGPATLRALVDLALERREMHADAVVQLFARRGEQADLRETNAQLSQVIAERDAARAAAGGAE